MKYIVDVRSYFNRVEFDNVEELNDFQQELYEKENLYTVLTDVIESKMYFDTVEV